VVWYRAVVLACAACGRIGFDPLAGGSDAPSSSDVPPGSPITVVQAAPPAATTTTDSQPTGVTFPNPPRLGDTIVVYAACFAVSASFVQGANASDSAGNCYIPAVSIAPNSPGTCEGGTLSTAIFAAVVTVVAAPLTVYYDPDGDAAQECSVVAVEYAGLSGIGDKSASQMTSATPSPQAFASGTTPTTTAAVELLVSVAAPCAGNPDPITIDELAGFTARGELTTTSGYSTILASDRVVTAVGAYSDSWSVTFAASPAAAYGLIATFR
jgi:hypothetical protein